MLPAVEGENTITSVATSSALLQMITPTPLTIVTVALIITNGMTVIIAVATITIPADARPGGRAVARRRQDRRDP